MRYFFVLLAISYLLFATPSVGAITWGLNAAAGVTNFSQDVADTMATAGSSKYVVVLAYPSEVSGLYDAAKNAGVNLIIRARHEGGAFSSPDEWISTFSSVTISPEAALYFMPVNEPNNPQEKFSTPISVRTHIETLLTRWEAANLSSKGILLLSPALDTFKFYEQGGKNFYTQLGGAQTFNRFDAIAANMYGQMNKNGAFVSNIPALQGDVSALMKDMGTTGKDIFILESGVTCEDCPREGGSSVLYPFDDLGATLWKTFFAKASFVNDARVKTVAPLIFDPANAGRGRWFDTASGQQVLAVMGMTANTGAPIQGGSQQGTNEQAGQQNNTIRPGNFTDQVLNASCGIVPFASKTKECGGNAAGMARASKLLADNRLPGPQQEQETIEKEESVIDSFLGWIGSWFGFVGPKAEIYSKSLASLPIQEQKIGGGADDSQTTSPDEVETTNYVVVAGLRPYFLAKTDPLKPIEGGITPTPVLLSGLTFTPPLPGAGLSGEAANVLKMAGDTVGYSKIGAVSNPITKYNYEPPFCAKLGSRACAIVKGSVDAFFNFQCVGFVAVVHERLSQPFEQRHAKSYCNAFAPPGYTYYTYTPDFQVQINDLVMWTEWQYGHIALVTNVWPGMYEVHEANWGVRGTIGKRIQARNTSSVDCVLRKQ